MTPTPPDKELDEIFYNPEHTKTYNPSGKQTGVTMTDYDIFVAKQAINRLIARERLDEVQRIPNPAVIGIDGKRVEPVLWYRAERTAKLEQSLKEEI